MQNHFDYFTEIEDRFNARRGSLLLLSALDWALIETWREAGVPLPAVLRGIDDAFDKYEMRLARAKGRLRKVNGLAWCAQAVMQATEKMAEAAMGAAPAIPAEERKSGFEAERVADYLDGNAAVLDAVRLGSADAEAAKLSCALRLRELAEAMRGALPIALDELDRTLTVLEEKLLAAVMSSAGEAELVQLREQADRELMPYRGKMTATQIKQVQSQFLQKRLLQARGLPRLSLFYMGLL